MRLSTCWLKTAAFRRWLAPRFSAGNKNSGYTDNQRNIDIFDVSPVFFGYRMTPNTRFTVRSNRNQMSMEMVPINKIESVQLYSDPEIQEVERSIGETAFIGLKIAASSLHHPIPIFPITESGSLIYSNQLRQNARWETVCRSRFLSTTPMSPFDIRNIWEKVIRERRETNLIDALRTLEPDIESIHLLPGNWSMDNVLVDRQSGGPRIGIGSFGEGMRRLLDLALALIDSANGVLLIDEIDTGLHWTVMEDLWRFIIGASRRSNVQVFATTHSYDCLKGLASLMQNDPDLAADVSLQKVERALPPSRDVEWGADTSGDRAGHRGPLTVANQTVTPARRREGRLPRPLAFAGHPGD